MTETIPQIDVHSARRELCKKDLTYFVEEFWSEIISEPMVWNWHMTVICEELQTIGERVITRQPKTHDQIFNVPPSSTKSTLCSVMFPAWLWAVDPSIRVLSATYTDSLSTNHSVLSRDIIRSEKYQRFFPHVKMKSDQDGKTHYKNISGGERLATSVTGSVTGFHAHVIIVDDPLSPKQASSDAQRQTALDFMDVTLSTRKVNKELTPTILVMQRLHEDDPTGHMLKQQRNGAKIKHICIPAEDSINVKPDSLRTHYVDGLMDAQRLPRHVLSNQKILLGSYGYAGQYSQAPAPLDGGIFKPDQFGVFDSLPVDDKGNPMTLTRVGTDYDLAYTEKESNSASASVTAGIIGSKMYVIDVDFVWFEFPKMIQWMKGKTAPHYIEAKASGKSAKQVLTNQGINAIEVKVDGGDKIARATMATPYIEAGRVLIHRSVVQKLMYDETQGLAKFPNNSHMDLADALVQSINRLLNGHQVFTF